MQGLFTHQLLSCAQRRPWVHDELPDKRAFSGRACVGVSVISTPSRNVTPWMTLGNWFSLFKRRHVLAVAITRLNTINRAVSCDSAPFVRVVRWRTVANTLSIGFDVCRWSQCSAGKS
jgi:hypothetical protein